MAKQPDPIPPEGTPPPLTEGYLTAKEAAERMGLSVETVRAMCNDGSLSGAVRKQSRWYVPLSTVEAWGQRQPEEPPSFKGGRAPASKVIPATSEKEPGPPAWWQRFRNHPWVFYPTTVISAFIVLIGVIFSLIQAGADFGGFSRQVKEWGLVREFPAERKGETLIVIAQFYHSEGVVDTQVHKEIRDTIHAAAQELGESSLRVAMSSVPIAAEDQDEARKLGHKYKASVVIWGADTGVRVTVNFFNLKHPDFDAALTEISETQRTQIANPNAYASYIVHDLPAQLSFLSLFALGQSYYSRSAYGESIRAIEKGISALPSAGTLPAELSDAYFRLGWQYREIKDNEQAIDSYTNAIDLEPEAFALNNRGNARADQGDFTGALADYDKAISLRPDYATAYFNRGIVRDDQGDLVDALADYERAIALEPGYAEAYNNRGNLRARQGDLAGALADYERCVELRPDFAQAYFNRGGERVSRGDLAGAKADYDKVISLQPENALAYYQRGYCRSRLGDPSGAVTDFNKAITLNLEDIDVYLERGNARDDLGDSEGAIADFDKVIELQPDYVEAYNNRGNVRSRLGDLAGAIADFDKAIEAKPNYAPAYNNRGTVRYKQDDLAGALSDYNEAITLDPDSAKCSYNRGLVRFKLGDLAGAVTDYDKAIEIRPDYADAYANRGHTRYEQGDLKGAIADVWDSLRLRLKRR